MEERSKLEVPNEVLELKSFTDNTLINLNSKKKIEILWSTSKFVKENVFAEFRIDNKTVAMSNRNFSKNNRSYYFADKKNKPKYMYLVYVSPSNEYKMDYTKLDLFSLDKIKYSGYVHYFDLDNNFIQSNYYFNGKLNKVLNRKNKDKTKLNGDKVLESRTYADPCYWYSCTWIWNSYIAEYVLDETSCVPVFEDPTLAGCDSGGGIDCTNPWNANLPECGGGGGGPNCEDPIWANSEECNKGCECAGYFISEELHTNDFIGLGWVCVPLGIDFIYANFANIQTVVAAEDANCETGDCGRIVGTHSDTYIRCGWNFENSGDTEGVKMHKTKLDKCNSYRNYSISGSHVLKSDVSLEIFGITFGEKVRDYSYSGRIDFAGFPK